ncbi:hypothetical protein ASC80_05625 [Afipia sp. Root123D2]|uniref:hypothetical protein n=1 Tax=Afipia sp. Root123D2 TaxID=1736436 RepID=UPI0006F3D6B9|nr:hypothetical protein [Afipia sp. Root123D2]KQW22820.1 hypothetical protein ASC80_05625 [Afipia sp. Root123D2]
MSVAALPLAFGIAADILVVFYKISEDIQIAIWAGLAFFAVLVLAWYIYPLLHREHGNTPLGNDK